jgi:hypothetical protein
MTKCLIWATSIKTIKLRRLTKLPNKAAFTTKFVLDENKLITSVAHHIVDGAWEFLSDDEFENFESVAKIIGFNELLDKDPSLREVIGMNPGYVATRKFKGDQWKIKPL